MLARLEDISLFFPDKAVLGDVSLTIYPGDRLILFGENGSGKTSLFHILTGRLKPNSGAVSLARGLRIGYLEQDFAALDGDRTCLEVALEPFGRLIALEQHDLLLFDEPTNHLDIPAREWLEERLSNMNRAYVVASHDRGFLDAVGTKVAHLDGGGLTLYAGNYSAFCEQREQRIEAGWRSYEKGQKRIRRLREQAQSYRGWSNAREKEKRGVADKGFVGHRAAKLMKRSLIARRRMEEAIEQAETDKPFERDRIKIDFHFSKGNDLLLATDLTVGYYAGTEPLVEGVTIDLRAGDRLAVVGPNGCGKTALLRTLLGELAPLSGEVRLAPSARIGYFDQDNRRLPNHDTALGAVLATGRDGTLVRTILGRMGVRRETVNKPPGQLSSGERAKVLLAKLILGRHSLLVLDEPTNHLDIETQDVLLDALQDFPGGILFVSHDRHFIDALATHMLLLG
jgi:ATPase subunit of ABC transporter with duplicated ATPase domains